MKTLTSTILKLHTLEATLAACEKYPYSVPVIDSDGRFSVGRETKRNGMPSIWAYLHTTGLMMFK